MTDGIKGDPSSDVSGTQCALLFPSILISGVNHTSSDADNRQTLTTSKKKSTCGLLCTKNLTGCLSMTTCTERETDVHVDRQRIGPQCVRTCRCVRLKARTLRMKSGGVPGLTVGLRTPSW